jgi:hypothetical protein
MPKMFSKFKKKLTKSSAMSSSFVAVISPIENPVPTGCSTLKGVSVHSRSNGGAHSPENIGQTMSRSACSR